LALIAILEQLAVAFDKAEVVEGLLLCDKVITVFRAKALKPSLKAVSVWVVATRRALLTSFPKTPESFPSTDARLAFFRAKLGTSDKWACHALELIYQHQTAAEQASEQTVNNNGVGFSGRDAQILSSFAKQYQTWKAKPLFPRPLSGKQMAIVFKRMPVYAAQLIAHLEAQGKAPLVVKPAKPQKPAAAG
jgi:hypothetical protein